jgi:outer membrane usher protein
MIGYSLLNKVSYRYFNGVVIRHVFFLMLTFPVLARDDTGDYFNPAFLERDAMKQGVSDLSMFEEKGGQAPGVYRVDLYINNEFVDTRDIEFGFAKDNIKKSSLLPCISVDDLAGWGVLIQKYPGILTENDNCANLSAIPQASSDFRLNKQSLLLSFPHSALKNAARGWTDDKYWDDGISAFILNYAITGSNTQVKSNQGFDSNSQYVSLQPGVNIGPWRFRNYTTWVHGSNSDPSRQDHRELESIYTYLKRDIKPLKSKLLIGESSTQTDVFDSIPFFGAQLDSDDGMLPESLRGYAPSIRGIARSNAQVTVSQNGYIIYQTYVAPGSFEITDMYPTGGAGDMEMTIKESDGSEQYMTIPYASLPVLQREGRLKYSLTSGKYRPHDSNVKNSQFMEATLIYGLPFGWTLYGGAQASGEYRSLAFGSGKNMGGLGAISFDITEAQSTRKNLDKETGGAYRVRYSKNIQNTGTNFSIAGYRYATDGYWSLQEVLDTYDDSNHKNQVQERRRNRAEMVVSQSLGRDIGNLALSAIREDSWGGGVSESYSAGFNSSFNGITYGINYTRSLTKSYSDVNEENDLFSFNINVPFSTFWNKKSAVNIYAGYSLNASANGETVNSATINGTMLNDNSLSWSVQQQYKPDNRNYSGGVAANWKAPYGELNAGYVYDEFNHRINYGLHGGIIGHNDGLTLSQSLGDTIALVSAPGADGVSIKGQRGVKTNAKGYAVVPFVSPYRKNDITLDMTTMNDNTDITIATQTVVPTWGAVTKASYKAVVGYRALINITQKNGMAVPFGALVSLDKKETEYDYDFIVGDAGQVYLTGLPEKGSLFIRWGSKSNKTCNINYVITRNETTSGIETMHLKCS